MLVFHPGDPAEIHFKLGSTSVAMQGKVAQFVRPLLEVHLTGEPVHDGAVHTGMNVLVVVSGGTGIYTAEASIQRYQPQTGQLVLAVNGSFRFQQRRQHERYRCKIPVRLRVVGDSEWVSATCRDISAGGARLYLSQEFVLRSNAVEIIFISPDSQQGVRAIAEVVRTSKLLEESGWELGIRFTEMDRMEKIRFARLLQHWASVEQHEPAKP
ncbi:MAG: PilZ domain-containing protein [Chthonomonadetes bacterium]|nr:PilZ domain-containing protein [Chthonomonadetes bacterium]